jgi:nickel/cobalt transporter (NiCoT) family protein
MAEGQRPLSVGFFFSLGHSTIVLVMALLFALGIRGLADDATLHDVTSVIGPAVSGSFLFVIGALNLAVLAGIVRGLRRGAVPDAAPGGLLTRIYGRATATVRRPWHMYPLGALFGLGFDTATEVGLLLIAAGAAGAGLPVYAILCLPILFAAGMSLLDTLDGAFMNFAYGWAFSQPARKAYYNLTVTGLSVVVALGVGGTELLGLLGAASVDLNLVGYVVAGLFVGTWALALAIWRFGRIEQRWTADLQQT